MIIGTNQRVAPMISLILVAEKTGKNKISDLEIHQHEDYPNPHVPGQPSPALRRGLNTRSPWDRLGITSLFSVRRDTRLKLQSYVSRSCKHSEYFT